MLPLLLALLVQQDPAARLAGHVPAASLPGINAALARAVQDTLPTEPLVEKALEGGAKGAGADRIVAAVNAEADHLRNARDMLRRAGAPVPYSARELESVSVALARGVPDPVVARVVSAVHDTNPGFALHAVADLTARGFAPDSSADLIIAAAGAGMSDHRLLDVAAAAERDVQRGSTRAQALAHVRAILPAVPLQPLPPGAMQGAVRPRKPGTPSR